MNNQKSYPVFLNTSTEVIIPLDWYTMAGVTFGSWKIWDSIVRGRVMALLFSIKQLGL